MWYDELCEYYKVSPEEALELGTRSSGRKPNLPASSTCKAISNMTFEDIWESKPRTSNKDILDFYIDQGAWSTFRQCVRHIDLTNYHISMFQTVMNVLSQTRQDLSSVHILEYGCGVAPFITTFLKMINNQEKFLKNLKFSISDVDKCEHFIFADWRLNKINERRNLNLSIDAVGIKHDSLPSYSSGLDVVFIFEVLEHVPSPIDTLNNLMSQMNDNCLFVENFIKHEHSDDEPPGPDLDSAADEREDYYKILTNNFKLITNNDHVSFPNQTRIWMKNTEDKEDKSSGV